MASDMKPAGEIWRAICRHMLHGLCRHRDMTRVHVDGVWFFVCSCGYRVPIVRRYPKKDSAIG